LLFLGRQGEPDLDDSLPLPFTAGSSIRAGGGKRFFWREAPGARLALELAISALVAGHVDLARHIYTYAAVAGSDAGQLPALLSTLTAVLAGGWALPPKVSSTRASKF
jgi:hypothetical protein